MPPHPRILQVRLGGLADRGGVGDQRGQQGGAPGGARGHRLGARASGLAPISSGGAQLAHAGRGALQDGGDRGGWLVAGQEGVAVSVGLLDLDRDPLRVPCAPDERVAAVDGQIFALRGLAKLLG